MTNALIGGWCEDDLGPRRWLAVALLVVGLIVIGLAAKLWRDEKNGPAPVGGVAGELERLARLRESGALSEDEFATAKSRALAQEGAGESGVGGQ